MLPDFKDALESISYKNRASIKKYLEEGAIRSWEDFDRWHLTRFATNVKESMAASSAFTTFAVLKSFLKNFKDELNLPEDWREILSCKNEQSMKTYLTAEEVERFGKVRVQSLVEQTVREGFYVSCKTGLRHSDLVKLLPSNFQKREEGGWYLVYVSKKTKIQATVVCSDKTKKKVEWLVRTGKKVGLNDYNVTVRTLAERAGITDEVVVFKAGEELHGPKWQFLSSHSARVSFCTILSDFGTDILDTMRLAGHSNPGQTARYIVRHEVKVNEKVEQFLM